MSVLPPYEATTEAMRNHTHTLQNTPSCCHGSLVGYDPDAHTVTVVPMTCGRWACPDCAARKAATYAARLYAAAPERHITLTWNPHVSSDPQEALRRMKKALPKFVKYIRDPIVHKDGFKEKAALTFEYCAIWERHRSGFPHLHLAQWGDFIPHQLIRRTWKRLTGAYIIFVKAMDNDYRGGHHWTKYLLKSIPDTSDLFPGTRMVTFSHAYDRNAVAKTPAANGVKVNWRMVRLMPEDVLDSLVLLLHAENLDPQDDRILTLRRPPPWDWETVNLDVALNYSELKRTLDRDRRDQLRQAEAAARPPDRQMRLAV